MRMLRIVCVVGALAVLSHGEGAVSRLYAQANQNQQPQQNQQNQQNQANATGGNAQSGWLGGMSQSPWFSHPAIRQQLQLNDDQFNQLNKGYAQSWSRFNQGISGLEKNLSEKDRLTRQRELSGEFNREFSRSIDGVLTDQSARQRYNQLYWQYGGYGAFLDPNVQKQLNLTDEQRQKFNTYTDEWNQSMNGWRRDFGTNRDEVQIRFNDARKELRNRIDSTLTPEQRTMWRDMQGKPAEFPIDTYFGNGTTNNPTRSDRK